MKGLGEVYHDKLRLIRSTRITLAIRNTWSHTLSVMAGNLAHTRSFSEIHVQLLFSDRIGREACTKSMMAP